jgi:elongation factor Ts
MTPDDIPVEVLDEEKAIFRAQMADSDKPERVLDQIVDGKLKKFYTENCLMEQPFIKDGSITVKQLVQQTNALLGENIVVRRFVRFEVGN